MFFIPVRTSTSASSTVFIKDKKILKRVNYWVTIGIVLIICIGIFTWWNNSKKKTPHHKLKPQPALIDNTSTRSASYPTKEFKNLLSQNYPDIYKNLNFKQKPTYYVISRFDSVSSN